MLKNDPRKFSYLIISSFIFAVIFILLYIFLGRPTLKYVERTKAEFQNTKVNLLKSQELIAGLPDPQKAIVELERKALEFKEMGLTKKQLPRMIKLLGEAASASNINIISVKLREDIKSNNESLPEGISKIYLEMVFDSNYQELADYTEALAKLPVSFVLESLSVAKKPQGEAALEAKGAKESAKSPKELQAVLLLSTYTVLEL